MKKISFLILPFLFFAGCKTAENNSKTTQVKEPAIETLGGKPVYVSEFSYVYNKNNATAKDAYTKENINEYLNLYTNFKLKVREAEELGLDTAAAFQKELDGYKRQLAQPYLTEKGLTDQLTKEAYERMKEEINASHILINLAQDAEPKDTLKAYTKIMEIRQKAVAGESFESLAQQFSQDPSAKTNKGNLGYFTAMQMVYPFENAVYNTKKGDVSMPVRTRFGYHIIKVYDRRKSQGQVKVAHIMVRATSGLPEKDSIAAKEKIAEIYTRLKNHEDWNTLTSQFSDDVNSKTKGGELPWFSAGKLIPSFEEASFALQKPGDFSSPVLTPYGWHIIKLIEKKELESFQQMEPSIKSKVNKDRAEVNKIALLQRLKKENNFIENPKGLDAALLLADSSLLTGSFNKTETKANAVLFEINKKKYTINNFLVYIKEKQRPKKNITPVQYMRSLYTDYTNEEIISYEEAHLGEKYPDYKMLVKEYRDGILLFQLMDERVWSKAIEDTAGLKNYFNQHRDKYKWDFRAHAAIFNLADKTALEKLKTELKTGKYEEVAKAGEVSFPLSSSTLSSDAKQKLDNFITQLSTAANNHEIVEISGSATAKESKGKNLNIAKERAESIRTYLINKGIDSSNIVTSGKIYTDAKHGNSILKVYAKSLKVLERNFNVNAPLTLQITEGVFQKGENEILNQVEWKEDAFTVEKDNRIYYTVISKIDSPRNKTFEEARGLAISDYQNYLEEEWLKQLKKKYPVVINNEEVQKLISK
jgi:peptidyl-prolyl cis-trans isomerase SurA